MFNPIKNINNVYHPMRQNLTMKSLSFRKLINFSLMRVPHRNNQKLTCLEQIFPNVELNE